MTGTIIDNVITRLAFSARRSNLFNWNNLLFILLVFCFFSCNKNPETYIKHLEGYWEIEKVTMADGSIKEYKLNETIDYISLNDSLKGFRKKLKPSINDTYLTSDDAEEIQLKVEDNELHIYYSTPYTNWKETVLEANTEKLKVINKNKTIYLYRRYIPINITTDTK